MDITEQLTHESRIALAAAAEITRLRARLEVRDDGGPDGILCRDESIRMQDAEIARLRAEVEALRADAERWRYINTRNNVWRRHNTAGEEHSALCVILPYGADLSCRATREIAIDAARAAQGEKT